MSDSRDTQQPSSHPIEESSQIPESIVSGEFEPVEATLTAENIGGINHCSVTFTPGLTILTGENATNRTSLLTALNGVLGGSEPSVKTDAETGSTELTVESDEETATFTRSYERSRGSTQAVSGTPLTDDTDLVDTFVTLLETNDARTAVTQGSDIREVLMRPVDTAEIERRLREKTREKKSLKREYEQADNTIDNEASVIETQEQVTEELDVITEQIDELQSTVEEYEADEEMAEQAEELVSQLESKRSEIKEFESEIQMKNSEIAATKGERKEAIFGMVELFEQATGDEVEQPDLDTITDIEDELEFDKTTLTDSKDQLEDELSRLRAEKSELEDSIDNLEGIVQFTESTLTDMGNSRVVKPDTTDVTAQLAPGGEQVDCWTCGTTVDKEAIRSRSDELRSVITDKKADVDSLESEIESVKSELKNFRQRQRQYDELNDTINTAEQDLERLDADITDIQSQLDDARDELQQLQEAVSETEELRESELPDVYEQLTDLQYKRGQKESRLSEIEDELDEIATAKETRSRLKSEIETVEAEIESLRTRVEMLERGVVDEFNNHMSTLLDQLEYDNLARVWIERRLTDSPSRSSGLETGEFILHVVRKSDDGAVYEDLVDNLSESEREVVGLITALAGYIVHDVAEEVPFLILDSIEAIDSERLVSLVEYIETHAPFVTAALLPEDASAFGDSHNKIPAHTLTIEQ